MITKICKKCGEEKSIEMFSKNKECKFGVTNTCKTCGKAIRHQHYLENREKVLFQSKEYYNKNREEVLSRMATFYDNNYEKIVKRTTKYSSDRLKTDELYKFKHDTRALIRCGFKRKKYKKNTKTSDILGCSFDFFKTYLESKWLPGMSWENHTNTGWHVDHIIPISLAKTEEDVIKLSHYTNFQPLWAIDNIRKSDKIIP